MVNAMNHRGPDDRGVWCSPAEASAAVTVSLGNNRLAILDLSPSGHQPMHDNEGNLSITYNGEAYNFRELRKELGQTRGEFRSHTDTEVVLRAYRQWGSGSFDRLRGMFAMAIWDSRRQELVLARDPIGIKPLYYYRTDRLFVFASEIRALLASGLVPPRLDRAGLASYLDYGSVQGPATIIDGVRSVLPGHYLMVRPEGSGIGTKEIPFAQNISAEFGGSIDKTLSSRETAVAALREKLEESVRLHLVSDVPLGVFLSGGMDSSAIVALMSRVTAEKPKTFSVIFDEEQFNEAGHSRLVAEKFRTEHREIHLGKERLLGLLPDALQAMDQPTMDGVNTFVVSKAVKEAGVTVALSGLGGDELFAGYPSFRRALRLKEIQRFSGGFRRSASGLGRAVFNRSVQHRKFWELVESDGSPRAAYAITRQLFAPEDVQALFPNRPRINADDADFNCVEERNGKRGKAEAQNGFLDPVNAMSALELQGYMANTLLRDTDFMSMAHSLEVRVPYVDKEVVNFVLGLPGQWKIDGRGPKPLLRDAVKDLLPDDFLRRPKMGFTLPFERWMQSRLRADIGAVFADEGRFSTMGISSDQAGKTWQHFLQSPRKVGWSRPWSLYVLGKWCQINGVA